MNAMAARITSAVKKRGFAMASESATNQIFPILPNTLIRKLSEKYLFYTWERINKDYSAIRIITSWATSEEAVDAFIEDLNRL